MTTLVALPTALEEAIRCLPAVEALAASGRRLLALADPRIVPLLRLAPAALEPVPRLGTLASRRLLVAGCEEAVILSRRVDDGWLARTAGIPQRWGYASLLGGWFLSRRARRPPSGTRPASEGFRELLAAMAVPWVASVPRLAVGDENRQAARERLARAHIGDAGGPLVGVYPGIAGGGADRPWPRARFEELVRRLRRRRPELRFVLLATTEDLWTAVRVHEETGKIHPVIGPDLKLDALAALLAELDEVVAVESWMLDLAAAAGTRTVGLHLRDPRRWGPPGPRHRAIAAGKRGSIAAIELERVAEVVASLGK